jgi:hypothetical protein
MIRIQRYTLFLAIGFIIIAIVGFIPGLNHGPHHHDPALAVDESYGRIFGLFAVNVLHNLVHFAFGVWAWFAAKREESAVKFCRFVAVAYGILAVFGLLPPTYTAFGLVPLFGHDVWLHAGIALSAAYFGFGQRAVLRGRPA